MRPPRALIHASKPLRPTRAASVPSKTSESESFSSSANSTSALLEIPRKSQKNDPQAQFTIQPINQFLSYRPALTLEQYGQPRIAKAHSHHGQISQTHFQGDMFLSAASIIIA